MNDATPPKLISPRHSTSASGILPTAQVTDANAMSGPANAPHREDSNGCPARKNCCQTPSGTPPGPQHRPDHHVNCG